MRAGWMLAAFALVASAEAQEGAIPRTPAGRPDFTGVWSTNFMLAPLERPAGVDALVVSDEQAQRLAQAARARRQSGLPTVHDPLEENAIDFSMPRVGGQWRSSLVTEPKDGKAPLTEAARALLTRQAEAAALNKDGDTRADGPEALGLTARCLGGPGRAPFAQSPLEVLRQFVQTDRNLLMHTEALWGETRIVAIGAKPRPPALTAFDGDSVASWDGDVLVVETVGMRTDPPIRPGGVIVQKGARVVERLQLTSEDALLYQFTVIEPNTYTRPWSAEFEMRRSDARVFEAACHEGNYAMAATLRGARRAR